MAKRRRRAFFRVPGEPARVAGRAAARLAYLGDRVQPLAPDSFLWRPQPAEEKLFACPHEAVVTALPADEDGFAEVSLEWRPRAAWLWRAVGWPLAVALAAGAVWAGWPWWRAAFALLPGLALAGLPRWLDSGWFGRLRDAVRIGRSPGLERVPAAEEFLQLDDDARAEVVAALREAAETIRTTGGLTFLRYRGADHRSDRQRGGWPLYHTTSGVDPVTDRTRVSRGWLAVGQLAIGRVAIGQAARGWLAIGQAAMGLIAIGQAAGGVVLAIGQAALSGGLALAQAAVALGALGMLAAGGWSRDMGLPPTLTSALLVFPILIGSLLIAVLNRVRSTPGLDVQQAAQRLESHRLASPLPDDQSLSLAATPAAEADRGLSLSVGPPEPE